MPSRTPNRRTGASDRGTAYLDCRDQPRPRLARPARARPARSRRGLPREACRAPSRRPLTSIPMLVSWTFRPAIASSVSRMPVRDAWTSARSTSASLSRTLVEGEQPRQPNRRLERRRLRVRRVDDRVDVAGTHVERRDARRRVLRREHHERRGGVAVGLGGTKLVAHLAAGHSPVLRLDDDPQVAAAAEVRVEGQHEVALLRAPGVAGLVAAAARAGRWRRGRCRRACPRGAPRSRRPWPPTSRARRRAPPGRPRWPRASRGAP